MKYLLLALVALLLFLQYRFWVAEGSYLDVARLNQQITAQKTENTALRERNRVLSAEVESLKRGNDTLEERARSNMGMVKDGETFFLFLKDQAKDQQHER